MRAKLASTCLLAFAALASWSCSDKDADDPAAFAGAVGPSAVRKATLTATPIVLASPSTTFTCPVGNGTPNAQCGIGAAPVHLLQVQAAVQQAIALHPELVDATKVYVDGGVLVLDAEKFHDAVIVQLQAAGICGGYDFERNLLQVKQTNDASEDYELLHANGYARAEPVHETTCAPAAFPLSPADVIHHVRVGFYDIECWDGQTVPNNNDRELPVDCIGLLTATPKKADNSDVHSRIHGPEITWTLTQVDDYVLMTDDPEQPFNKILRGLDPGEFTLCATVQGVEGCMVGHVTQP